MRAAALCLALAGSLALAACGQTISQINARPERHYQKQVRFIGQVSRLERLPGETLVELVGQRGGRILVKTTEPAEVESGDWVSISGLLVPETRVGDQVLYDVVVADRLSRRGPPRIPDFM
jgi:hypothetical protein